MIATLDERHIARGYDPYNSADQPWVMIATNKKFARNAMPRLSDDEVDERIRRGLRQLARENAKIRCAFQHLASHGYEFFPPKERVKIIEPTEAERHKYF